jgi:hypothetical protein
MNKTSFKAPSEHSLILACFILVWIGPVLKLAGVLACTWWLAFIVLETIWAVAALAFLAYTLVGTDNSWVEVQVE